MERVHIYHTNDLHSHFENWPRIEAYLAQQQKAHQEQKENVFTFDIGDALQLPQPGLDSASSWAAILIAANFQSTAHNGVGAYIAYVTRLSSGAYVGIVQSTGVNTGFSGAPTVTPNGVLNIPLTDYYRARVVQIDFAPRS